MGRRTFAVLASFALCAPLFAQEVRSPSPAEIRAVVPDYGEPEGDPFEFGPGPNIRLGQDDPDSMSLLGAPLTEAEGRALVEISFRQNGLATTEGRPPVDGFDPVGLVGFAFLSGKDRHVRLEEARRLQLEGPLGGPAVLILPEDDYRFEGTDEKTRAVDRLLEDVRRFLVWLARENRLPGR